MNLDSTREILIVFGGFYGKFTNNIFYFHLDKNRWEKITTKGTAPEKRAGHCGVLYKDSYLFVSGGGDFDRKFNDMWRFDLENLTWMKIDTNDRVYQVFFPFLISFKHLFLKPGIGHSMVLYEDNLIIFGGIGEMIHEKNDLVIHNLIKKSWKRISFDSEDDIEINDFKQNVKPLKKMPSKNTFGFLPRSNTKAPTTLLNSSLPSLPKRNSLKQIMDEFSTLKTSKESEKGIEKILKSNTFHEIKPKNAPLEQIKSETKNRSPKSLEKSPAYLARSSSLLKKAMYQSPTQMKERINETKKKHLLDQFEIFDEKLRNELLHITPTTEIMKSTITIFHNSRKDDLESKKKKIMATSFEFRKKENIVRIGGSMPCPRDGHSAVVFNQKMIIIGGDRQQRQYNDFFECNLKQLLS